MRRPGDSPGNKGELQAVSKQKSSQDIEKEKKNCFKFRLGINYCMEKEEHGINRVVI